MSHFGSFQKELKKFGFKRLLGDGPDKGCYYHPLFLRGRPQMATLITRKNDQGAPATDAEEEKEPNFYEMPHVFSDHGRLVHDPRRPLVAGNRSLSTMLVLDPSAMDDLFRNFW